MGEHHPAAAELSLTFTCHCHTRRVIHLSYLQRVHRVKTMSALATTVFKKQPSVLVYGRRLLSTSPRSLKALQNWSRPSIAELTVPKESWQHVHNRNQKKYNIQLLAGLGTIATTLAALVINVYWNTTPSYLKDIKYSTVTPKTLNLGAESKQAPGVIEEVIEAAEEAAEVVEEVEEAVKETLDVVKVAIEEADNVVKEVKKIEETAKEIIEDGKDIVSGATELVQDVKDVIKEGAELINEIKEDVVSIVGELAADKVAEEAEAALKAAAVQKAAEEAAAAQKAADEAAAAQRAAEEAVAAQKAAEEAVEEAAAAQKPAQEAAAAQKAAEDAAAQKAAEDAAAQKAAEEATATQKAAEEAAEEEVAAAQIIPEDAKEVETLDIPESTDTRASILQWSSLSSHPSEWLEDDQEVKKDKDREEKYKKLERTFSYEVDKCRENVEIIQNNLLTRSSSESTSENKDNKENIHNNLKETGTNMYHQNSHVVENSLMSYDKNSGNEIIENGSDTLGDNEMPSLIDTTVGENISTNHISNGNHIPDILECNFDLSRKEDNADMSRNSDSRISLKKRK